MNVLLAASHLGFESCYLEFGFRIWNLLLKLKISKAKTEVSGIKPEKLPLYRIWRTQFEISGKPFR